MRKARVVEIFWHLKIDMDTGLDYDLKPDSARDQLEETDISDRQHRRRNLHGNCIIVDQSS